MTSSCPGCGLSLSGDAIFCPTCGWRKYSAGTVDAWSPPDGVAQPPRSAGPRAASAQVKPEGLVAAGDEDSIAVSGVRKVLGFTLLPAVVIVESVIWYVALAHVRFTFVLFGGQVDLTGLRRTIGWLLLITCVSISIIVTEKLCPPVGREYRALLDRRPAAPGRTPVTLARVALMVIPGLIWLVIVVLRAHSAP